MSIITDTASFLITNNIVEGTTDWKLFEEYLPAEPDKVIVIDSSGGEQQEVNFDLSYPSFQIRVRGEKGISGQREARQKAVEIKNTLHTGNFTMGTISYAYVLCEGDILPLGRDGNNRPRYSINFRTARNSK